jgi:hypothetical protein
MPENQPETPQPEQTGENQISSEELKMTYKQYGFDQSRLHNASPVSLETELKKVRTNYLDDLRKNEAEQHKLKEPFRQELISLEKQMQQQKEALKEQQEDKIPEFRTEIQRRNTEIEQVHRNPEALRHEKPNRLSFIIGVTVMVVLTIYLWIFYTSAGYSAFFRDFEASDIKVANSIFDAEAIVKAWNTKITAFVLVASMPFIFLALGYLIHKTLLKRHWTKWLQLAGLIIITFCFDFIIAYEIVYKIYDLQRNASPEPMAEYTFAMSFQDINFWLIIFAGFVTYLIWGFMFDYLMHEYELFDVVKQKIKVLKNELKDWETRLQTEMDLVKAIKDKIADIEQKIKQCESTLASVYVVPKDFEHIIFAFGSGWLRFIEGGQNGTLEEKDKRRLDCNQVIKNYLEEYKKENLNEKN